MEEFGTRVVPVVLEVEFDGVGPAGMQTRKGCRGLWRGHRGRVAAGGSGTGLDQSGPALGSRRLFFVPRGSS